MDKIKKEKETNELIEEVINKLKENNSNFDDNEDLRDWLEEVIDDRKIRYSK